MKMVYTCSYKYIHYVAAQTQEWLSPVHVRVAV